MDEQTEGNAEVLDAVNQQKNLINSYLLSKTDIEVAPSVIPATASEKPDLLYKKDFLLAVEDLKKEKNEKTEPTTRINQTINPEEAEKVELKDLTPEQEEKLKNSYPEIDFKKPLGPNEDKETTLRIKRELYENLEKKEEKKESTPGRTNQEVEINPTANKKENNVPNIDKLDTKLKALTKDLPEPPPLEASKDIAQDQPVLQNTSKIQITETPKPNIQPEKPSENIESNSSVEYPKPQPMVIEPPAPSLPESGIREVVQQSVEKKQQNVTANDIVSQPVAPSELSPVKATDNVSINTVSQKPVEINEASPVKPQTLTSQVNVATTEEPLRDKTDKKPNLPVEDQSSQQPLKITNYSEASLDELNKNISSLNNNVNNISNMLANATTILANIASKEGGVTNINNIGGGGGQQKQQYQLIAGGIDGYRQSFRTPNNANDILGRTLTPNIPGVSYV